MDRVLSRTHISIKFRPIVDIKKTIKGVKKTYFYAGKVYDGAIFDDKNVTAYSPHCRKTIFVNPLNIKIELEWKQ